MMRRLFSLIIGLIGVVLLFTACGKVDNSDSGNDIPQKKQCEHEWIPADCLKPKVCSKCGIEEGTPLGHDVVEDTAIEATLLEKGRTEGSHCGRCGIVILEPEEVPPLIDVLLEMIKTNPDKYSDGIYTKYYYSPDFENKSLSLSRFKDCTWLVTLSFNSKENIVYFESAARMDPGGVGTIRIAINCDVTPKRYNYVYNWDNSGTSYWFAGTFEASTLTKTKEVSIDECYGISSDRKNNSGHKEKVADMLKQLVRLMNQLFQHEKIDLRMSNFGIS